MRNVIHHVSSLQHFQYLNKNTISNVTYERAHLMLHPDYKESLE